MKLKVVDLEGRKLYFRESVKRNLFKIISLLPWYLGCIWAFFTDRKQAWHDMFAKTLVVNVSTNMVKVTNFEKDDSFEDNDPFAADLNEADSYEAMNENNNEQESKGCTLNDYEHTVCVEACEKIVIQPWIVVLTIIVIVVCTLFLAYKESL